MFSVDTTPPIIDFCPDTITDTIELGLLLMDKAVTWIEPRASDISGNVSLVSQSHLSGDHFMVGRTEVKYVFRDGFGNHGNEALCTFYVTLNTGELIVLVGKFVCLKNLGSNPVFGAHVTV